MFHLILLFFSVTRKTFDNLSLLTGNENITCWMYFFPREKNTSFFLDIHISKGKFLIFEYFIIQVIFLCIVWMPGSLDYSVQQSNLLVLKHTTAYDVSGHKSGYFSTVTRSKPFISYFCPLRYRFINILFSIRC